VGNALECSAAGPAVARREAALADWVRRPRTVPWRETGDVRSGRANMAAEVAAPHMDGADLRPLDKRRSLIRCPVAATGPGGPARTPLRPAAASDRKVRLCFSLHFSRMRTCRHWPVVQQSIVLQDPCQRRFDGALADDSSRVAPTGVRASYALITEPGVCPSECPATDPTARRHSRHCEKFHRESADLRLPRGAGVTRGASGPGRGGNRVRIRLSSRRERLQRGK
jgi:hypothetical protein